MALTILLDKLKRLSPELAKQIAGWNEENEGQSSEISIVVCGLLKAGKSTLLNMLTGNITEELFKSGEVRETTKNKSYSVSGLTFVDTPGIDATCDDDKEAFAAIYKSDVLVVVHSPPGELQQQEIDYLKKIVKVTGRKGLEQRLVMVISHLESYAEIMDGLSQRVLDQCKSEIGVSPQCFCVSNTRYRKGQGEEKAALSNASNIPKLKDYLTSIRDTNEELLLTARAERLSNQKDEFRIALQTLIRERRELIDMAAKPYVNALEMFSERISRLRSDVLTSLPSDSLGTVGGSLATLFNTSISE